MEDLPDLGRNYCIECAKWFDTDKSLGDHRRAKPHKRRFAAIAHVSPGCFLTYISESSNCAKSRIPRRRRRLRLAYERITVISIERRKPTCRNKTSTWPLD